MTSRLRKLAGNALRLFKREAGQCVTTAVRLIRSSLDEKPRMKAQTEYSGFDHGPAGSLILSKRQPPPGSCPQCGYEKDPHCDGGHLPVEGGVVRCPRMSFRECL